MATLKRNVWNNAASPICSEDEDYLSLIDPEGEKVFAE